MHGSVSNRVTADYGNICEEFTLCLRPVTLDNKVDLLKRCQKYMSEHLLEAAGGNKGEQPIHDTVGQLHQIWCVCSL